MYMQGIVLCAYSNYKHLTIADLFTIIDHMIKATFPIHKLIPKNVQMTTIYTNWSLYITLTMIYYIRQG